MDEYELFNQFPNDRNEEKKITLVCVFILIHSLVFRYYLYVVKVNFHFNTDLY